MLIDFKNFNINDLQPKTDFQNKTFAFLQEWFSDSETVQVQTSGSTGAPKIFEVEKIRMRHSAKMTSDFLGLKTGDSALLCLPVEYISGKMMIVRAAETGLKLHVSDPSINPLQDLSENMDFCAMTPLQVENSLAKIHLIRKLIIGGAAVSEPLKEKIFAELERREAENGNWEPGEKQSTTIYETYGMSETLSHIALKELWPFTQESFSTLAGIRISTDERGCLTIFAPQLLPEPIQTNDLVEITAEDEFRFLGRTDNVINSGGAKIFPEILEAFIKKHIPREAYFVGIPDEKLGQKLTLAVEGEIDEDIMDSLQKLKYEKSFHRPKEIIFVEQIPRTPNGKVDRRALTQLLS